MEHIIEFLVKFKGLVYIALYKLKIFRIGIFFKSLLPARRFSQRARIFYVEPNFSFRYISASQSTLPYHAGSSGHKNRSAVEALGAPQEYLYIQDRQYNFLFSVSILSLLFILSMALKTSRSSGEVSLRFCRFLRRNEGSLPNQPSWCWCGTSRIFRFPFQRPRGISQEDFEFICLGRRNTAKGLSRNVLSCGLAVVGDENLLVIRQRLRRFRIFLTGDDYVGKHLFVDHRANSVVDYDNVVVLADSSRLSTPFLMDSCPVAPPFTMLLSLVIPFFSA